MKLKGLSILVTRPEGQGEGLAAELRARGARVYQHPALKISPLDISYPEKQRVLDFDRYQTVIFVSTNAVKWGMKILENYWPQWPLAMNWLAVGKATARLLEQYQVTPAVPVDDFTSEGLLALPCMQEPRGARVLIVRGQGGRPLLAEQLTARGASVDYLEVYAREQANENAEPLQRTLSNFANCSVDSSGDSGGDSGGDGNPERGVVIVTSVDIMDALLALSGSLKKKLLNLPLIVVSQRIADVARQRGFSRVSIAKGASDDALLQALDRLQGSR